MTQQRWTAVDQYISDLLIPDEAVLDDALRSSEAAGLPPIHVSAAQGKLLNLLAKTHGARAILEIGTLGGYSTIWLARSLPSEGRLVTLEIEPLYADIARTNIARAGLSSVVDIRLGPALETLARLPANQRYDMIFIDADKEKLAQYFDRAVELSHRGTLIIADNVVRDGEVVNQESVDSKVQGVQQFFSMLADDARVDATVIQTVGVKGYDGFAVACVLVNP